MLYGHGAGFKEVLNLSGFLLKGILAANGKLFPEQWPKTVVVVTARDGYRAVLSAGEIMNRNDNQEFLLNDLKDSPNGGRYTLIAPSDYFADRNVKSVDKIILAEMD